MSDRFRDLSREPGIRELLAPPPKPRARRRRFWSGAVVAAAIVVAILLVLVAVGVLRLAPSSSAPLTVTAVHWTVLQGTINNSSSEGWFGPSEVNYTGPEGYPLAVSSPWRFTVSWVVSNLGGSAHTVYSANATAPFRVLPSLDRPSLPQVVPGGEDTAIFTFTIQAPADPGASYALNLTVNALGP